MQKISKIKEYVNVIETDHFKACLLKINQLWFLLSSTLTYI